MPKIIDKEINRTNISETFTGIDSSLTIACNDKSFENAVEIAKSVMGLLGFDKESINQRLVRFDKLQNPSNDSWTKKAPGYADRKASYELASDNNRNIDFKIYWAKKANKRTVANLVALTPNFEDEDIIYAKKNVGIDFVVPDDAGRLIIVLSNNYKMRTLELHKSLTNTQKKIFEKWFQIADFENKAQLHQILWDSFDIHPLNKEFYKGIASFFTEEVQHLLSKNILDEHHAKQFTTRLIGRLIFCWFLRKKNIIAEEFEYFEPGDKDSTIYYQEKLERLFFEVLNTPLNERETQYSNNKQQLKLVSSSKPQKTFFEIDQKTPFLNGGLFEAKESDLYSKNEISFPADYFKRFIKDFLDTYNFTTDESTSDFQQVAIDPEMLGRIFENLLAEQSDDTGEQARKSKGAFYTPREIVDYMCRESLRQYLSTKLGEDPRKDNILSLLLDKKEHEFDYKNDSADIKPYKATLVQALDDLKLLDPACGSGAFPIGMLQIILSTYIRLDRRYESYTTKKEIIHETLYGIDIEPTAVEIARLRTWLSLIVDVELKPNASNFGIDPLPNLDFKFVCANSLIPLAANGQQSIFDDTEFEKSIKDIREEYFASPPAKRKKQLQSQFETLVGDNLLYHNGNGMSERQKQLRTYHPFDSDNVCQFFDSNFMFGVDGFDIVIGNPPYVNIYKIQKDAKSSYSKLYSTAYKKYDLYVLFFERAMNILKEHGCLCLITSNKFLSQPYGLKLREAILKFNINEMINFRFKVFEATVDTIITLLNKQASGDFIKFLVVDDDRSFGKIFSKERKKLSTAIIKKLPEIKIRFSLTDEIINLLNKIDSMSLKLNDIAYVNYGCRLVSKIDNKKKIDYVSKNVIKGWKPFIEGQDIRRFYIKNSRWVDYSPNEHYLSLFPELFESKKLVAKDVVGKRGLQVAFDDSCFYDDHTVVNAIKWDSLQNVNYPNVVKAIKSVDINLASKYSYELLVALLNSKLVFWYFEMLYSIDLHFYPATMQSMPIFKNITEKNDIVQEIEITTRKIIEVYRNDESKNNLKLEEHIDQLIYMLYDLTQEEIDVIERIN